MTKKVEQPISRKKFLQELRRYERGSITRRQFLGVTGLGTATAVLGAAMPSWYPKKRGRLGIWEIGWFFRPGQTTKIR